MVYFHENRHLPAWLSKVARLALVVMGATVAALRADLARYVEIGEPIRPALRHDRHLERLHAHDYGDIRPESKCL